MQHAQGTDGAQLRRVWSAIPLFTRRQACSCDLGSLDKREPSPTGPEEPLQAQHSFGCPPQHRHVSNGPGHSSSPCSTRLGKEGRTKRCCHMSAPSTAGMGSDGELCLHWNVNNVLNTKLSTQKLDIFRIEVFCAILSYPFYVNTYPLLQSL